MDELRKGFLLIAALILAARKLAQMDDRALLAPAGTSGTTYFSFVDHLGTERVRATVGGSSAETCTSLPFGDWLQCSGSDPSPIHFTGQERDSETGNDNFGARYYGSSMGRFLTPDPSNLSVDFWLPQTWNRYSYALNNPLSIVDRNGLWPTSVHEEIINEAFPGLSAADLQILKTASYNMDYGPGQQDAENAYQHGMSNGLNGANASGQDTDRFIADKELQAQKLQSDWIASGHGGISPQALTAFGNALHAITDRVAPFHVGYQPWYGVGLKDWGWAHSLSHFLQEGFFDRFSKPGMNMAVSDAQQAFQQTFGFDEFDFLNLQQQQQEVVTHGFCSQDENGNITCP